MRAHQLRAVNVQQTNPQGPKQNSERVPLWPLLLWANFARLNGCNCLFVTVVFFQGNITLCNIYHSWYPECGTTSATQWNFRSMCRLKNKYINETYIFFLFYYYYFLIVWARLAPWKWDQLIHLSPSQVEMSCDCKEPRICCLLDVINILESHTRLSSWEPVFPAAWEPTGWSVQ